jgi:hypothetical protein
MSKWSYTSTPAIRRHGVDRANFTVTFNIVLRPQISHPLDIDSSFLGVKCKRGVTPTILLHLVTNLRTRGARPPSEDVFMV